MERHYSFYDKWFEINITLDANGKLFTEPGPIDWSFNCDICTPCFSIGTNFFNIDLELDILVSNDGIEYVVIDEDDFDHVISQKLITENERNGARKGLENLFELISSGNLIAFLEDTCSFNDLISLSEPIPSNILQLSEVSILNVSERESNYGKRL